MRHGTILAAVVAMMIRSGAALAADPSPQDIAQARDLGGQAQAAFDASNYSESEKLWAAAANLYPAAPTLTLGLARTQAKLGKLVSAQESYNKIIREQGQAASLSPAFKDALEAAKAEVGPVSARIASVVISVEGAASPQVTVDGQPLAAAALGLKRPIDPGAHTVRAEAPGFKPAETTFQVAESGAAEAKLKLEKAPDAPAPVTATATKDEGKTEVTTAKSSNKTLALVAFGVGGAGLVFGTITGLVALGKHGDLDGQCPEGKCPSNLQDDIDGYKTMGTLSTVGFIVGGVGAVAGAVLWFTAPKETASARASGHAVALSWQPYLGAGGGGIRGRF